jgi:hypothetical protein
MANEIVTRMTKKKAMESTMKSKTEFAAKVRVPLKTPQSSVSKYH